MPSTSLVWFRNDLRIDDNEALFRAVQKSGRVCCVYVFDPRQYERTPFGFPKTGPFRARFLRESVADLRSRLRKTGSDLIVRQGRPEKVIPQIAGEVDADSVFFHEESASEERAVENALRNTLQTKGVVTHSFWGHSLLHPDDLPFGPEEMPDVFTGFRKAVEKTTSPRPLFSGPESLSAPQINPGEIPSLHDLGLVKPETDPRSVLSFQGGESAGLTRLQEYIWERDCLRKYKETRNGLLGADFSSKFSAWLSAGCLSPRRIQEEVRKYETERIQNKSTYWLIFELLWRDYYRFLIMKYGDRFFRAGGLHGEEKYGTDDPERVQAWIEGRTGFPFVDANMREIGATGYMSNRGRQNVASFFARELGLHWQIGAEYFESQLIDYDVTSNWGNWLYVTGHGTDPREDRWFNTVGQGKKYDSNAEYIRHWVEELQDAGDAVAHEPWKHGGVKDYPRPIVKPDRR